MFRVDEMLRNKGTRFLTGDTMCCFDCELMPKLQHIRVAGKQMVYYTLDTNPGYTPLIYTIDIQNPCNKTLVLILVRNLGYNPLM